MGNRIGTKEGHVEVGPKMALPTISVSQSLYFLQFLYGYLFPSLSLSLSSSQRGQWFIESRVEIQKKNQWSVIVNESLAIF